jgi:hypothetical protein
MKINNRFGKNPDSSGLKLWSKIIMIFVGFAALLWFLIRVIPKPSRALYPCQRAAFPVASAFVIWMTATVGSMLFIRQLHQKFTKHRWAAAVLSLLTLVILACWLTVFPTGIEETFGATEIDTTYFPAVGYNWEPGASNQPVGVARGIFPGRVVMVRNPLAAKWAGNWKKNEDQWWLDRNTDIDKVSEMLSLTLQKVTGTNRDKDAWDKIFKYHNENARGLKNKGYSNGELVAVKVNINNSSEGKADNYTDVSPQMVLAMVRQLVIHAGVPQNKIVIYDVRRMISPALLTKIWTEFKDVRFVQANAASKTQPVNPGYGDYHGLEASDWVEGMSYSKNNYKDAKLIPRQVVECTYLVNLAMLKAHSYPYNYMEDGDEGQTAVSLSGKNHFGSIKGTPELHAAIDTKQEAKRNSYSPIVDLAASPNLGRKTILFVLDGLYCGRKWRTYPLHFPNPPFNNKTTPYENPEWPACVLASLDEVAIESVGLDLLYAQSKNNTEPSYHNVPRLLIRDNADDYLFEMATPENAPSGTKYIQDEKPVKSLGVHEHWDSDLTMRYSRNIDPENGKGIEFIYIPLDKTSKRSTN